MTFNRDNVYDGLNAEEACIGWVGYFANNICTLKRVVEGEIENYKHVLSDIEMSLDDPLYDGESYHPYFYLVSKVEKKHRPYTYTELCEQRDRWYKRRDNLDVIFRINSVGIDDGIARINGIYANDFLKNYVWEDGESCGVEVCE